MFYLEGIQHICDPAGYDHMLYLLALAAPYGMKDWKRLALLASAFTLGHSLTLALASTGNIAFRSDLIEWLIPCTIAITALGHLLFPSNEKKSAVYLPYIMTSFFGLIHGLGFSSYLKMMFDDSSSIAMPLLAFNLGVETGQLLILTFILLAGAFIGRFIAFASIRKGVIASGFCLLVSGYLLVEKWPF